MKILFVHQNFPGQFLHLAPALQARGHECLALTDVTNNRSTAIQTVKYRHSAAAPDPAACRLGRNFTQMSDRGVTVARATKWVSIATVLGQSADDTGPLRRLADSRGPVFCAALAHA